MSFGPLASIPPIIILIFFIWSAFWKILALWRAAQSGQQYWFIALFLINTVGILDIIYLAKFSKKKVSFNDWSLDGLLPKKA